MIPPPLRGGALELPDQPDLDLQELRDGADDGSESAIRLAT
jgi:hypothetical protein